MFTELPWDEPTCACPEYIDWKDCKITRTPWNKIDNLALCKYNVDPPVQSAAVTGKIAQHCFCI